MKIIDLLNKIANGEEVPKKVKYRNNILYYDYEDNENNCFNATFNYYDEDGGHELFKEWDFDYLNDEIEIIEEEKKIEKMSEFYTEHITENGEMTEIFNKHELAIINKINEIIDYLQSKGE